MAQAFLGVDPGTTIADALAPALLTAEVVDAETTTGAWVEVPWPGNSVAVKCEIGNADADLASFSLEIQGSDTGSGGGTNVVKLGRFADIEDDDDNTTVYLPVTSYKRYMRAVAIAGTGGATVTVTVVPAHTALGNTRTA